MGFQEADMGFQEADMGFQEADMGFQEAERGLEGSTTAWSPSCYGFPIFPGATSVLYTPNELRLEWGVGFQQGHRATYVYV